MTEKKEPRKPIQQRGKAKKNQILLTAKQLFIDKNYFEVSTNEIATQAGVSIGTLYAYFSSKESILAELLTDYHQSFLAVFEKINRQEVFQTFKTDPQAWLSTLIDQLVKLEDQDFHSQVEMLAHTVSEVQDLLKAHHEKIKNLTYECFLYYANKTSVDDIKTLSIVMFDYISALVDELLYTDHSPVERETIKQCGVNSLTTMIQTMLA